MGMNCNLFPIMYSEHQLICFCPQFSVDVIFSSDLFNVCVITLPQLCFYLDKLSLLLLSNGRFHIHPLI